MLRGLLGLVGAEFNIVLRRTATTALLLLLGVIFLGGALLFGAAALFICLADAYGPLTAALAIAGGLFVLGALLLVIGYSRLRSRRRREATASFGALAASLRPANQPVSPQTPLLPAKTVMGIAAVAAIAGLILGRRF